LPLATRRLSSLAHLYPKTPLILGHRGASAYAPENTLAAFRRALELGADGFELDVTLSADGVPVVIHDDTVDRTTDGNGAVAELSVARLKTLDAGRWRGPQFAGERLPTLEEVFTEFGAQAVINIELKRDASPARELAAKVVSLIRAHRLGSRVVVSSFYYDNLRRVKQLDPALPVGLLYSPDEPWRVVRAVLRPEVRAEAHHPHFCMFNALTRRWYRAAGRRVNVWTVNAEADLRRLIRLGVDGVITDRPDVAARLRAEAV
jgi:glycerophosphoryl diester phosphodiesterase